MAYVYKHFIPENTAPKGTKSIGVYNAAGEKTCTIPLGRMAPPTKEKSYSFGLISDVHLQVGVTSWNAEGKFPKALQYFKNQGCDFVVHCGDAVNYGVYHKNDSTGEVWYENDLAIYYELSHPEGAPIIPIYGICGNHESYGKPITENLAELKQYTGCDLYFKMEYQNDVFIFCGQPSATIPMSDEAFTFLTETLSASGNKRCFVFVHPVWNDDSGDANEVYANHAGVGGPLLSSWSKGAALKNLLKQYPNVILFHGHTHIKFEEQVKDKALNYTNKNGFHSVHVPSLGRPRDIVNDAFVKADSESQGYIIDVYGDCIVLNGMDFVNNIPVPLGVYKIDTGR